MKVLKFYGTWCQPCKLLDPIFEEIEENYDVDIKHVDVDDDANAELMTEHAIRSLPTVVFLDDDGEVIETLVGTKKKREYTEIIENN